MSKLIDLILATLGVIAIFGVGFGLGGLTILTATTLTSEYTTKQITVGDLHWLCLTKAGDIQSCTLLDPYEET